MPRYYKKYETGVKLKIQIKVIPVLGKNFNERAFVPLKHAYEKSPSLIEDFETQT